MWSVRAVFFNLGSEEPKGSAKIFLGSAKYLFTSSFCVYVYKTLMLSKKGKSFHATESNLISFKLN